MLPKVREHETEYLSGNDKNEFFKKYIRFVSEGIPNFVWEIS